MSFWDSSAIVPLCVYETSSPTAVRIWRQLDESVIAWNTPVEVVSAFARIVREGKISELRKREAEFIFVSIEKSSAIIPPETRVIQLARTFPDKYGLKAGDCIQLASALVWCKENPSNKDFICGDGRLLKAAEAAGFSVHDLS